MSNDNSDKKVRGVITVNGSKVFLEDIQEAVNQQSQVYIAAFTPALVQALLDEITRLKNLVKCLSPTKEEIAARNETTGE